MHGCDMDDVGGAGGEPGLAIGGDLRGRKRGIDDRGNFKVVRSIGWAAAPDADVGTSAGG